MKVTLLRKRHIALRNTAAASSDRSCRAARPPACEAFKNLFCNKTFTDATLNDACILEREDDEGAAAEVSEGAEDAAECAACKELCDLFRNRRCHNRGTQHL